MTNLPIKIKLIVAETARDWPKLIGPLDLIKELDKMTKRIIEEINKT